MTPSVPSKKYSSVSRNRGGIGVVVGGRGGGPKRSVGRQDESIRDAGSSSSTAAESHSNPSSQDKNDPQDLHYRQNFGKDGIYVSPPKSPARRPASDGPRVGVDGEADRRPTTTTGRENTMGRLYKSESPFEDRSDPDIPFDHSPSDNDGGIGGDDNDDDSGIRNLLTISSQRALNTIKPQAGLIPRHRATPYGTDAPTPLRNPRVSDLEDSVCTPQSTRFESIWLSSPEASPYGTRRTVPSSAFADHDGTVRIGLFTVTPPKFSEPSLLDEQLLAAPRTFAQPLPTLHSNRTPPLEQQEQAVRRRIEAQRNLYNIRREDVVHTVEEAIDQEQQDGSDTLFDFVEKEESNEVKLQEGNKDDILYKNIRVTHKVRRKMKQRRKTEPILPPPSLLLNRPVVETEDDTSTDCTFSPHAPTNLQQRAHQAWKSRQQKKNSSLKVKLDDSSNNNNNPAVVQAPRGNVSFGKSTTVHHFESEGTRDDGTVCDRSLNSEYTKTMESEVEDMIKDILFIGSAKVTNPGRRQIRHKPSVKRKIRKSVGGESTRAGGSSRGRRSNLCVLQETTTDTTDDDQQPSYLPPSISNAVPKNTKKNNFSTRGRGANTRAKERLDDTADESTVSADTTMTSESQSLSRRRGGGGDDRSLASSTIDSRTVDTVLSDDRDRQAIDADPFAAVLGFMEGGLTAVSSAIEYAIESAGQDDNGRSKKKQRNRGQGSSSEGIVNPFESCTGKQRSILGSGNDTAMAGMVDFAQDLWFGPYIAESGSSHSQKRTKSKKLGEVHDGATVDSDEEAANTVNEAEKEMTRRMLELGTGEQVAKLAIHAAHSVHRLQGIEYDESVAIDMYKDLKICDVHLMLPLGSKF